MRKPASPLAGHRIEVPDARYRADVELHDRYQQFSAELLRLSLGGIAAVGVVLGLLADKDTSQRALETLDVPLFEGMLISALLALVIAAAAALLHRFYASDGLYHHLRAIKLLILIEQMSTESEHVRQQIHAAASRDEETRNKKFYWSTIFLGSAGASLAVASALFCICSIFILLAT
jgi:hypothetical protein